MGNAQLSIPWGASASAFMALKLQGQAQGKGILLNQKPESWQGIAQVGAAHWEPSEGK